MARKSTTSPAPRGAPVRLAIITAEFNRDVNESMRRLAHATAKKHGATVTHDLNAPGVLDMPVIAHAVLDLEDVDALVVLGAVITGETKHDEVVANNAAFWLERLAIEHGKPLGFGVTGPGQTAPQARARVDRAAWAVESVLKQLQTLRSLRTSNAGAH